MIQNALRLLVALAFASLFPVWAYGQATGHPTLGETDETWSGRLGSPVSFWRDAWRFEKSQVYTRSWYTGPRERTGSNHSGYSPSDYSVRYVEFVRDGLTLAEARSMMRRMLPTDSQMRRRATAFGSADTYRSTWLIGRIRPLLAGDQPCISPWGYGPGIIKVGYYRLRDKAVRVVAELGEPHEVPISECSW